MSLAEPPPLDASPLASVPARNATPRKLSMPARAIADEPVAEAISPVVLTGGVRLVEFLLIVAVGAAVQAIWIQPVPEIEGVYPFVELAVAGAAVLCFQVFNIYKVAAFRTHVHQLSRLGLAWALVFLIALALSFFAKHQNMFSRLWIAGWFAAGLVVLFGWRLALSAQVRRWADSGRLIRRVVILGGGKPGKTLARAIMHDPHTDLRICGVFDDRADDRAPPVVSGVPKLGTVDDLIEFTRRTRVDLILVSLPLTAEERVLQMVRKLWVLPVDVRLAAHMNRLRFRPRVYSYIGAIPVLDIFDKPIADWNLVVKSAFDRLVGGLILLALAPLMAAVAIAIKLDSRGPVLFRQRRHGFNNEVIEVLKFRTLHHRHADHDAKQIVVKNDPRITRVGRLLRKTSIDELPQLINVLRGELSLVGPRPHALNAPMKDKLWEEVVDEYFARHRVKPGITGWAQINGWRGGLDTAEKLKARIDHDLYYIENWSLLFDIYILVRTPLALLESDNAY